MDGLIADPKHSPPMPAGHPAIDAWMTFTAKPSYTPYRATVPYWHPAIEASYRNGTAAPAARHPSVNALFAGLVPLNHPSIDEMIADPAKWGALPAGHPPIDVWVGWNAQPALNASRCVERAARRRRHALTD